ncbi:MAG: hypothetical protein U9Q06_01880 [Nanoarchaeota archaeon]|nr:hypothetical protein [Nanoarchaeota archaeon]
MKIHIDISGQIQQKNLNSALGCKREDGIETSVFMKSKLKKEILQRYHGQVTNIIEKIHCILIFYCIKDFLENVDEVIICRDVNFRRLKRLLQLLFGDRLKTIKISQRRSNTNKSPAHRTALKTKRHRKYAKLNITKRMVEDVLFEFKM